MIKDKWGYVNPIVEQFYDREDLINYLKKNSRRKLDYDKIRFEHAPYKISLVIADKELKDIFAYYREDRMIKREHIDLRKEQKKKKKIISSLEHCSRP
jgi:hypothetical protein